VTKTIATVTAPTTALAHTGHRIQLPAGRYEFVDIDGAADRGVGYIKVDGTLMCIDLCDPNITISEEN
jgi:hypothetical protein